MIRLFENKWGQTWQQRMLDICLAWVKHQFEIVGVDYPADEIAQKVHAMQELLDESGMRKLAKEGIYAVLFIRVMEELYSLCGQEMFDHLNAEMEAGRLSRSKDNRHIFAALKFCASKAAQFVGAPVKQVVVVTAMYLYRHLIGGTGYERAINVSMISGIAFAMYLLMASTTFVDAKAFMHPAGYVDPKLELTELQEHLELRVNQLLQLDANELDRKELLDLLHDAWRQYNVAVEQNKALEMSRGAIHVQEITKLIGDKEQVHVIYRRTEPNAEPAPKEEPNQPEPQPNPKRRLLPEGKFIQVSST